MAQRWKQEVDECSDHYQRQSHEQQQQPTQYTDITDKLMEPSKNSFSPFIAARCIAVELKHILI